MSIVNKHHGKVYRDVRQRIRGEDESFESDAAWVPPALSVPEMAARSPYLARLLVRIRNRRRRRARLPE